MTTIGLHRFRSFYQTGAEYFLTTCLILFLVNISLAGWYGYKDRRFEKSWELPKIPDGHRLQEFYPDLTADEVRVLRRETMNQAFAFEPFTLFRVRESRGRYLNVDKNGFRVSETQGPWPPDSKFFNVFLFGGSTAFGWLLPDSQTIASCLQRDLSRISRIPVRVYNFGRPDYFSTQERVLFDQLVVNGFRPDMAVFLDGLNDFHHHDGEPAHSPEFADVVEGRRPGALVRLPMYRASVGARNWLNSFLRPSVAGTNSNAGLEDLTLAHIDEVINRYWKNQQLIQSASQAEGIVTVFVWQPIPSYKFDTEFHPFFNISPSRMRGLAAAYQRMASLSPPSGRPRNFAWCADIQQGIQRPLYVDLLHYTAEMSRMLSGCITQHIGEQGFITGLNPQPNAKGFPERSNDKRR
ncbi:MAG: SGNH/GDSL hydrolase family protein [Acidobacteria bacterium]|nr:SGNH/GDSL hydrolase family protein [Acidobacteriota bacterium]